MKLPKQQLTVLGVHLRFSGYPNVEWRLKGLESRPDLAVNEINFPFRRKFQAGGGAWVNKFFALLRIAFAHIWLLWRCLRLKPSEIVYIPYPAVLILWMMSFLPRKYSAVFVLADAFISIYDTIVNDRKLIAADSIGAKLLKAFEKRAYARADCVIVDTPLNVAYFEDAFQIEPGKVVALPLSIDVDAYSPKAYSSCDETCTVLFVGTFVPLQGARTIFQAIKLLQGRPEIRFRLIGDGQDASEAEKILSDGNFHVEWEKDWKSSAQLADAIANADICLGIFGEGEKTQRVWPLKNYAYMAVGRALITGETACAGQLRSRVKEAPFLTVPVGDPVALADAISSLASNRELREKLAASSRGFYDLHLTDQRAIERICEIISAQNASRN